jgi:hypothetical protein
MTDTDALLERLERSTGRGGALARDAAAAIREQLASRPVDVHGNPITQEFHNTAMKMLNERAAQLEAARKALTEIARQDYRGNKCPCMCIAERAIAAGGGKP